MVILHGLHLDVFGVHLAPQPETTLLYQTVQAQGLQFLADLEAEGHELPAFVRDEFAAYLRCGILAHGFVRVRCKDCGESRAVAFSCKRRGFCPSCMGRRMADTAAFCIDHLFPHVPVRQFVLTVPMRLRFRMASSPPLTSAILRCFIAAVTTDLRRRAKRLGIRGQLKTGAITVVQRFGSSLALNVHFHTLAVDGVWVMQADGSLDFHPLPAPSDHDVARIARAVCHKVQRLIAHEKNEAEPILPLEHLANTSVQGLVAIGPRRGWRVLRLGGTRDAAHAQIRSKRCADVAGFNVHANTNVRAHDRKRLEVLVKYLAGVGAPALVPEFSWGEASNLAATEPPALVPEFSWGEASNLAATEPTTGHGQTPSFRPTELHGRSHHAHHAG